MAQTTVEGGRIHDLTSNVHEIARRRPVVGLVMGLVTAHGPQFAGHGFAHIASRAPVTPDTVFRIASITKTFTAIAIMQLGERGLIDLDAPADTYLRAFRLVPEGDGWRPPTVRNLLTHTAGIPDVRHLSDLLGAGLTPGDGRPPVLSVPAHEPLPTLASYYRKGLCVVVEPGTRFAYSNHGFATLGQIVEDVSGLPLERYFRQRIFEPLGMVNTDLVRAARVATRLATGYVFGRGGVRPVADRDWIGAGAGGAYSTARDLARYATALLNGGSNEHGSILGATSIAAMFEPQYQPDPRIPGVGLGFFRGDVAGHRVVGHDGILPGFNSSLLLAPDDGVALIAMTNGSPGAFGWLGLELEKLLRRELGLGDDDPGEDVPEHPETWTELSGRYALPPRSDLRQRFLVGGGAEVFVRDGRLMVRLRTPVPALYRGIPLQAADEHDPYVFRLALSVYGMRDVRVVFGRPIDGRAPEVHTDLAGQPWSLVRANSRRTRPVSVERLTAVDQVMLAASGRWPQDIGALVLLDGSSLLDADGRFRIEVARTAIESRLGLVPRFRQVIHRPRWGLGPPLWVDAPRFDITDHVRELQLESPVGQEELLKAVEELRRQRLDPSRPRWEVWFLTGLRDRQVGLFVRIHHTIADGMAAMLTMVALLDREADAPVATARPSVPARWPSTLELVADNVRGSADAIRSALATLARPRASLRSVMRAWPAMRELLAEKPGPETSLDRVVGNGRRLALLRTSAGEVRAVARAHDATINDLLLTVIAGGLRALLASRGERVDGLVLPIYVPVSLRRRLRGPQQGNQIGEMAVPLPLGLADPGERLRAIAAETTKRKQRSRPSIGVLMHGRIARRLMLKVVLRQRVNVMSACLPGPKRRLYLAGAPVLEVFPLLPLIANEALGVGAMSYAGSFDIGIAADRDAYPDLGVVVDGVRADLQALGVPEASDALAVRA